MKNRYVVRWKSHKMIRITESAVTAIESIVNQYCKHDPRLHIKMVDPKTHGLEWAKAYYNFGDGPDRLVYITAEKTFKWHDLVDKQIMIVFGRYHKREE